MPKQAFQRIFSPAFKVKLFRRFGVVAYSNIGAARPRPYRLLGLCFDA